MLVESHLIGVIHFWYSKNESRLTMSESRLPTDNDRQIAARIRACRLANSLSLDELAKKINISSQQVQKYETGINRVSAGRLLDISVALNVPITHLYDTPPDPQSTEAEPPAREFCLQEIRALEAAHFILTQVLDNIRTEKSPGVEDGALTESDKGN